MKDYKEALFEILKYAFWGNFNRDILVNQDWDAIYRYAYENKVDAYCYEALVDISANDEELNKQIPAGIIQLTQGSALGTIFSFGSKLQSQKALCSLLLEKEIPFVILKGTGLCVNYPKPSLRTSGDLDIYVHPNNIERAESVLKEDGYEYDGTDSLYHAQFSKNGYVVELHNSLPGLPAGNLRAKLLYLKDIDKRGIEGDTTYANYYVPNVGDDGLIQMMHILHHTLESGLKLRLLLDWMMFVNKKVPDSVWENGVGQQWKEAGLDRFAKILTCICKRVLGLNNDNITWCDDIKEEEWKPFYERISSATETEIKSKRDDISIKYQQLDSTIWERKSQKKESFILKTIIRNIKLVFSGKRNIKDIRAIYAVYKEKEKMLTELGIIDRLYIGDYAI